MEDKKSAIKAFHWSTVTGSDFGRSNRWSKNRPNKISLHLKAETEKVRQLWLQQSSSSS